MRSKVILLMSFTICLSQLVLGQGISHKDEISVGMSKKEVLKTIGKPKRVSGKKNMELLVYRYPKYKALPISGRKEEFFVRLIDGKVESYGKLSDLEQQSENSFDTNSK